MISTGNLTHIFIWTKNLLRPCSIHPLFSLVILPHKMQQKPNFSNALGQSFHTSDTPTIAIILIIIKWLFYASLSESDQATDQVLSLQKIDQMLAFTLDHVDVDLDTSACLCVHYIDSSFSDGTRSISLLVVLSTSRFPWLRAPQQLQQLRMLS